MSSTLLITLKEFYLILKTPPPGIRDHPDSHLTVRKSEEPGSHLLRVTTVSLPQDLTTSINATSINATGQEPGRFTVALNCCVMMQQQVPERTGRRNQENRRGTFRIRRRRGLVGAHTERHFLVIVTQHFVGVRETVGRWYSGSFRETVNGLFSGRVRLRSGWLLPR